jgi:pseudouridine-5'-phosphate glycosidase
MTLEDETRSRVTPDCLDIAPDLADMIRQKRPVVALESTIITHGMPYPQNAETSTRVETAVRESGAMPATIAILDGRIKVGLTESEMERLAETGQQAVKCSRRDLPFVVASGETGATTVAATMIIASMVGIRVFATGGIGGVHRDAHESMDISADLEELARTNVGVVCAGIKSVLDIPRTLEYLETKGVPVVGYCTDSLPAFYTRSSGYPVDYRLETPTEIAAAINLKWSMGLDGGVVIANPVPEEHALDPAAIEEVIRDALATMREKNITGKKTTPFLLAQIAERTGGASLAANIELVVSNATLAAQIARELAQL